MIRKSLILALAFLISACTTKNYSILEPSENQVVENINFQSLYFRGVFNWWEANEAYQLKETNDGWFVDIELIADGQPYDFKISDAYWSPAQTCGADYAGQQVIKDSTLEIQCGGSVNNLQFTPVKTAVYRFFVTPLKHGKAALYVSEL